MRVIRLVSPQALARAAADFVAAELSRKPDLFLALPTGSTPVAAYAEIVRRSLAGELSLARARIANLDEYCGLPRADPHSYAAFIDQHLLQPLLPAKPAQVRLLRGDAADLDAECRDFDATLAAWGGIDVCVLGLGKNGHIAFNEPFSSWQDRTRLVELSPITLAAQAEQAAELWQIPKLGITLGIKNVLEARQVLLLIAGAHKREAREALYRGVPDPLWPVTCLLAHPSVTVMELAESGPP